MLGVMRKVIMFHISSLQLSKVASVFNEVHAMKVKVKVKFSLFD